MAKSFKEGCGSKRALLPMMMKMILFEHPVAFIYTLSHSILQSLIQL
jgi:hypothetical protein